MQPSGFVGTKDHKHSKLISLDLSKHHYLIEIEISHHRKELSCASYSEIKYKFSLCSIHNSTAEQVV